MHSLVEIDEMNLLNLVNLWLGNIYQIQTKILRYQFSKKIWTIQSLAVLNCAVSFYFRLYLMLYVCDQRFDVTKNL